MEKMNVKDKNLMNLLNIAKFVTPLAPILGAALGGPLGGIAGSLVASVFGGSAANPADLLARIQQDADAAVKLKQIEMEHEETLKKLVIQSQEDNDKDTSDARHMSDARDDWIRVILTALLFVAAMGTIYFAVINTDTNDNHLLYMASMYFILEITQVFKYYFGGNLPGIGNLVGSFNGK